MQGLLVAGTGPDAAESAVAAALVAAAGDGAVGFVAGAAEPGGGPPAIAARHAGAELEPARILEDARAAGAAAGDPLLVVATSGGLLAPLAERYVNRDLAVELRLPLVVVAPAATGLMNAVLLALVAARDGGLSVPAVVLSDWPEQPSRALVDERAMLERHLPVPVEVLADGGAPSWPVSAWASAEPPAAPEPDAAAGVTLDPYEAWEERPVGDPRQTSRTEIMRGLHEIVAAEGPIRATRAFALYNRASGGRKLTNVVRAPLSSALYWLAQERRVLLTPSADIPWQDDDLIRLPDTDAVHVRELGPRTLEEVPLDEIAELAGRLSAARGISDATELKRAILGSYGLMRLTARADEYLGLALDLAGLA
jgi:hypothetical protein